MALPSDPQRGLAQALRSLRAEKGLTQEKLSKASGLHLTWISHLESGRTNPTLANVKRLASGLGMTLVELAAVIEEMDAKEQDAPRRGGSAPGG